VPLLIVASFISAAPSQAAIRLLACCCSNPKRHRSAEEFARADPYVSQGVVAKWRVCEWITVVGEGALTQV